MAKQTFTTGQVLTAAQMTSLQQTAMGGGSPVTKTASYVLVAADAGTVIQMNSASSTTITVNTALFAAGDSVFIQNIGVGVCTITAGTATVTSAGSLALTQWEGGQLYFTSTSASIFFDYIQAGTTIPLTTKGDLFGYDTANARVPIGTNGQVLTADSTQALGLKWATSSSGGMTLLSTTSLSGATTTISSISQSYNQLLIYVYGVTNATADGVLFLTPYNGVTALTVAGMHNYNGANPIEINASGSARLSNDGTSAKNLYTSANNFWCVTMNNYASTTNYKGYTISGVYVNSSSANIGRLHSGGIISNSAVDSIVIQSSGGNLSTGTVLIYGVK